MITQGTPFDFAEPTAIGARISQINNGYDHCLVVNREDGSTDLEIVLEYVQQRFGIIVTISKPTLAECLSRRAAA